MPAVIEEYCFADLGRIPRRQIAQRLQHLAQRGVRRFLAARAADHLGGEEGGNTIGTDGAKTSIYDASMAYQKAGTPLIVIAGQEYGTGSSRDWAAKGTNLLGVKAVVAQSFERIHRSNLVGMGVLPLQFKDGTTAQTLELVGTETYDIVGLDADIKPQQDLTLKITRKDGSVEHVSVRCRIDTPIEIDYYQHGGILPYVLRQLLGRV